MLKQLARKIIYPTYPIFKSQPDFLIIGVQRAATMSLYRYLIQHPQICVTHYCRETYYFDVPENYGKGYGWYLKHFPSKLRKGNKLTFEASPSYIYHKYIPQLIKQDLGDIKMIVILRNPVDRAYSAWQMYHSYSALPHLRDRVDERSFKEAIEQEFNPEFSTAQYPYNYIDRGKYIDQLKNYYQYFERESILVLNFEQFCQDLSLTLDNICDFLSIEHFSSEAIEQFKNDKSAVAKYVRSPGDAEVLEKLKSYFEPFNQKLYDLLGQSYNW